MNRGKYINLLSSEQAQFFPGYEFYSQSKKKTALLLLHGFSSSPAVYRNFFAHLKQYDAIVAPRLPGHATTLDDFATTDASSWLTCAETWLNKLTAIYERVDVLGLSLGGVLACHLSQHFNLNHLFLLAPALDLHFSPKLLRVIPILQKLGFSHIRAKAGDLHEEAHCEIAYRLLPLPVIHQILNFINHFSFELPQCATDLFLGKYDSVVNVSLVEQRFAGAAHVKCHWLNHSAHVLPLDGDSSYILQTIKRATATPHC